MAIAHDPYEVAPPVEHGWATTALHSMLSKEASSEELKSVWTTAALVLKGYDAVPVELKILLDRLFATYHDSIRLERRHRLAYLGWSEEEYERGYKIVVSPGGRVPASRGPVSSWSGARWQHLQLLCRGGLPPADTFAGGRALLGRGGRAAQLGSTGWPTAAGYTNLRGR